MYKILKSLKYQVQARPASTVCFLHTNFGSPASKHPTHMTGGDSAWEKVSNFAESGEDTPSAKDDYAALTAQLAATGPAAGTRAKARRPASAVSPCLSRSLASDHLPFSIVYALLLCINRSCTYRLQNPAQSLNSPGSLRNLRQPLLVQILRHVVMSQHTKSQLLL